MKTHFDVLKECKELARNNTTNLLLRLQKKQMVCRLWV